VGDNMTTDKKPESKEITTDVLLADIMLRLTAIETLLITKGVFTDVEFRQTMEDIAQKVTKTILDKAKAFAADKEKN
jgi:hypothetical protein